MDVWVQNYDPLHWWPYSTALAAVPVLLLLGLLISGRANAWQSALAGLAAALAIAIGSFGMTPTSAFASVGYGLAFAAFRIIWLIIAAVFLFDIVVKTGQFAIMQRSIAQLSDDRRLQAVLIAFCFGAFIEGAAGFGAPVAISAAFLVGLGFRPLQAAILCLVANTAPVAWGSIGIPIKTLAQVTGLDVEALSVTAGRILPPISFLIPIWLVRIMVPWRRTLEVMPALIVIGGTFAVTQFAWSNFVGVDLVDLAASGASLFAGIALLRVWKPKTTYRFETDSEADAAKAVSADLEGDAPPAKGLTSGQVLKAWAPFGLLSVFVLLWGLDAVKTPLNAWTTWKPEMPGLHLRIAKGPEVGGHSPTIDKDRIEAKVDVVPVTATGTAVFLAAMCSGLFLRVSIVEMARTFGATVRKMVPAIVAIAAMLALGNLTKYSGMDAVLGLAFTHAGPLAYPVLGAMLGWLGVALTGSDTASNVLFGNLQVITANQLSLNPILMASANSTGGVMGKMIDAQSIVVAAAAAGERGQEGPILRAVLWHSVILALMVGAVVWFYAHVAPGWIPLPLPPRP